MAEHLEADFFIRNGVQETGIPLDGPVSGEFLQAEHPELARCVIRST